MRENLSRQALQRLPLYYEYLQALPQRAENISATTIAAALGLNDVQVRKDLASVSSGGRPKTGYKTRLLLADIKAALAVGNTIRSAIVGLGNLGLSLVRYGGFAQYGLHIVAAFEKNRPPHGPAVGRVPVFPAEDIAAVCKKRRVHIGIVAVPQQQAQTVCNQLVQGGVSAIWNFAPTHLAAPAGVLVHNENMAASLALLSRHLAFTLQPPGKESPCANT